MGLHCLVILLFVCCFFLFIIITILYIETAINQAILQTIRSGTVSKIW